MHTEMLGVHVSDGLRMVRSILIKNDLGTPTISEKIRR